MREQSHSMAERHCCARCCKARQDRGRCNTRQSDSGERLFVQREHFLFSSTANDQRSFALFGGLRRLGSLNFGPMGFFGASCYIQDALSELVKIAGAAGCLPWWFHKGVKQQITALSWRQVDHAIGAKRFLTPSLRLGLAPNEKLCAAIRASKV
jgi:hypothetical protein